MAPQFETVLVDVDRKVATVTLNRPEKKNAINFVMQRELHDAIWALDADDGVRAIIVTGAGDAFCSGYDISAGAAAFGTEGHEEHDRELGVDSESVTDMVAYWRLDTPIIGAINGAAIGVGMTLPLLFDIRYAAEDAKLSFVFNRRGLIPEANSNWLLPRLVGVSRALDLLMTGRQFTGRQAADWGVVSEAYPRADLVPAVLDFAHDLADNAAPASVALVKRFVYEFLGETDREGAMARETAATWWTGEQPDAVEGVMAWIEKRPPEWKLSKHDRPPLA